MRANRTLRLLIGALTVGALLAIPAVASASIEWTLGGSALTGTKTIEVEATLQSENSVGGVECSATGDVKLYPGKNAEVTSFQLDNCNTFGEIKEVLSCEATGGSAEDLPWSLTDNWFEGVKLSGMRYSVQMDENCLLGGELQFDASTMVLEPNDPKHVQTLSAGEETSAGSTVEGESGIGPVSMSTVLSVPNHSLGLGVAEDYREWTKNDFPIQSPQTIQISGDLEFDGENGGVRCMDVTMDSTIYPDKFGPEVTSVDLNECETEGALIWPYGCVLGDFDATSLPWHAITTPEGLILTDLELAGEFSNPGCQFGESHYGVMGEVNLVADSTSPVSEFAPEWTLESTVGLVDASSTYGLDISPAGVYNLE